MKQIAITAMLILAVTASAALVAYTGSIHAAGVLVLLGVLSGIWAVRQAEWWQVRSLWRELVDRVGVRGWRLHR